LNSPLMHKLGHEGDSGVQNVAQNVENARS
jgi:hypothetical protein